MSDNAEELDNLSDCINSLTEKLNGVGIEIYHLNSTINSLVIAVRDLRRDDE